MKNQKQDILVGAYVVVDLGVLAYFHTLMDRFGISMHVIEADPEVIDQAVVCEVVSKRFPTKWSGCTLTANIYNEEGSVVGITWMLEGHPPMRCEERRK